MLKPRDKHQTCTTNVCQLESVPCVAHNLSQRRMKTFGHLSQTLTYLLCVAHMLLESLLARKT